MLARATKPTTAAGYMALACIAWLLIANAAVYAASPLIVKAGRGVANVQVATEDGVVVIVTDCPGGIGQVTVQNGDQPWPMEAKLRLRYEPQRGFSRLEGLTISDSTSQLHTFLGSTDVEVSALRGGVLRDKKSKPTIKIEEQRNSIEVTLPLDWFGHENAIVVHWVDVYRN